MTNRPEERTEADKRFAREPVRRGPNWGLIFLLLSLLIVAAFVISLVVGNSGPDDRGALAPAAEAAVWHLRGAW